MNNKQTKWLTGIWGLILFVIVTLNTGCVQEEQKQSIGNAEIHFIDTGNSDAILIKQGNEAALIDGGDNDDETMLPTYLKEHGVKELDYLFATHPDADHIGGLDGVIHNIKVDRAYVGNGKADTKTYSDFIEALMENHITPSVPLLNSEFEMGDASFKVLSVANAEDINNTSLVLLYTHGKDKVLLMGDADKEIEEKIQPVEAELIKIGHHGSESASGKEFLMQVKPLYAVITSGKNNKYGHPHAATMKTLQELKIPVYRTDESGSMQFVSTGKGITTDETPDSYTPGSNESAAASDTDQVSKEKPAKKEETIFFTKNGKKYHRIPNCSGMKAPIKGTLKDAAGRTRCDKCY